MIGRHRAEELLPGDRHVVRHVGEHVGREDEPLRLAAHHLAGALRAGLLDVLPEALQLVSLITGPITVSSSLGLPTFRPRTRSAKRSTNSSWTFASTIEAVRRHADLALVQELAEDGRVDGEVQVGVVEDDGRAVPAQLEGHLLEIGLRAASSAMCRPTAVEPGERDHPRHRMAARTRRRSRCRRRSTTLSTPGGSPASS